MHAVHDKPEIETLRAKNVAFIPASPGYKVTDNLPWVYLSITTALYFFRVA